MLITRAVTRSKHHPEANFSQRLFANSLERYLPKIIIDRVDVWGQSLYYSVFACLLAVEIVCFNWLFPNLIPFSFFELWQEGTVKLPNIVQAWPIFAWGMLATGLHSVCTRNSAHHNRYAERFLTRGFAISLMAGVFEEIIFRWLLFMASIPLVYFFGWCTFGLYAWLYTHVIGLIADYSTGGYLHHILYNGYGWAIGSAAIYANSRFRDGHKYQGLLGLVNSWYIGMFMFYVVFAHGLLTAIMIHFLYDMFIFIVRYADAAIERKLGWI